MLSQPSIVESAESTHSLLLNPRSIHERVSPKTFRGVLPPTWDVTQEYGQNFIAGVPPSNAEKAVIEEKTLL